MEFEKGIPKWDKCQKKPLSNNKQGTYIVYKPSQEVFNAEPINFDFEEICTIIEEYSYFNKGVEYFEKALNIDRLIYNNHHPFIAWDLHALGDLLYHAGLYEKSLEKYKEGLSIGIMFWGDDGLESSKFYYGIGKGYYKMGDFEEALSYFNKALHILNTRISSIGENSTAVSNCYFQIGCVYEKLGDVMRAVEYYEKAVDIDISMLGPEHPYTIEDKAALDVAKQKLSNHSNQ